MTKKLYYAVEKETLLVSRFENNQDLNFEKPFTEIYDFEIFFKQYLSDTPDWSELTTGKINQIDVLSAQFINKRNFEKFLIDYHALDKPVNLSFVEKIYKMCEYQSSIRSMMSEDSIVSNVFLQNLSSDQTKNYQSLKENFDNYHIYQRYEKMDVRWVNKEESRQLIDYMIEKKLFPDVKKEFFQNIERINFSEVNHKTHSDFIAFMKVISKDLYQKSMLLEYVNESIYDKIDEKSKKLYDKFFKDVSLEKDDFMEVKPSFSIKIDKVMLSKKIGNILDVKEMNYNINKMVSFFNSKVCDWFECEKIIIHQGTKEDNISFIGKNDDFVEKNQTKIKQVVQHILINFQPGFQENEFYKNLFEQQKVLLDLNIIDDRKKTMKKI